ncbi:hypothetical protein ID0642_07610 [Helicobacter pylori]
MSEISTYKLIKEKLQAIPNQRLKGSLFEKVCKCFLEEHDSADEYESIKLWSDWELNQKERDRGIDMVVTTTSKEYIAVQCKFYQDSVSLNDLSTFLTKLQSGVGEVGFKKGIIISTSDLSSNALEEIEQIRKSKGIDIVGISEEDFIYSQIDWEKFDPTQSELPICDQKKPRKHQTEAIKATKEYFSDPKNTRGGIDLIICDEAHRTVGAMYSSNERDDKNAFTLCHSDGNIKAKKRLYMTATPKVYSESSKARAKESDNIIYSMDDAGIFGEEIYTLNFEKAIALDLLTDYKVMILAVRKENLSGVTNSVNKKISRLEAQGTKLDKKLINNEFVCKIIGTHKGLAKQDIIALDDENKEDNDLKNQQDTIASQRAISFCKSIKTSKRIKDSFETVMECYNEELKKKSFKNLTISIDHIDGTMNCKVRLEKLEELNEYQPNTCKVLSNARCLSEGVDVPALDSIVFFDGKSAMVDIIQAVGRVMRKAKGKKRGYIILPIALEESEIKNLDEAVNNTNFKNIWKVIKALRSHDPSLVDEATFREKIKIFGSDDNNNDETNQDDEELQKDKTDKTKQDPKQAQKTLFDAILLQDLADAVYNVMPTKLGDRNYWENFAKKNGQYRKNLEQPLERYF